MTRYVGSCEHCALQVTVTCEPALREAKRALDSTGCTHYDGHLIAAVWPPLVDLTALDDEDDRDDDDDGFGGLV